MAAFFWIDMTANGKPPSRLGELWFGVRVVLLRARRAIENGCHPIERYGRGNSGFATVVERRSLLYSEADPEERRLELGKVQNLRRIAALLDRVEVPPNGVFSFWRQVGRCTKRRGFVPGRQLQEGCLIPAIGGGICQFTNALYAAALDAGVEVVERHPHTRAVSNDTPGWDATVAWNHIDLRLRHPHGFRIECQLTDAHLIVRIAIDQKSARTPLPQANQRAAASSCATCGQDDCHHWREPEAADANARAWLVDAWRPELAQLTWPKDDLLFLPLDGQKWNRPRYAWPTDRFGSIRAFPLVAWRRSLRQRRLAEQGAERQTALLASARDLARAYARRLPFEVRHLVVSQELLPFLWRDRVLGGRTFDVLMSRLPMHEIHRRLDEAATRYPERKLLTDFRAPGEIVEAERQALAAARSCITAHSDVAAATERPHLLAWPPSGTVSYRPGEHLVFPGPTAARKGAYEVREAARRLGLPVVLLGAELEGADFWAGISVRWMSRNDPWLEGALAVVQPAIIEDRPIALLIALASGCPVIATPACGLPAQDGLSLIPAGDVDALVAAIR